MINSFALETYKKLFFDIFHKNNKLFLICPVYLSSTNVSELHIFNDGAELNLLEQHSRIMIEPSETLIYSFQTTKHLNKITVKYNDRIEEYELPHIISSLNNTLSVTTLFKDDYKSINVFYNYYIAQGVTHFYMYYNGKLTDDIIKTYNLPGVTLIEWDFQYWNSHDCKFTHHAQMGQMTHALYRYGKDDNEYMIFCDLDEYMYIPGKPLLKHIKEHPSISLFGFLNRWCDTQEETIPEKIPNILKCSRVHDFGDYSKCLYKTEATRYVTIHGGGSHISRDSQQLNNILLHFYKWSGTGRQRETTQITTLNLSYM